MVKLRINQSGFEHISLVIVVVVVGILGFIGFRVSQISKQPTNKSTTNTATSSSKPSKLTSKGDVSTAKKNVENETVESDLDPAQLDKDLSSLQ